MVEGASSKRTTRRMIFFGFSASLFIGKVTAYSSIGSLRK
jgi:hypothetical protein